MRSTLQSDIFQLAKSLSLTNIFGMQLSRSLIVLTLLFPIFSALLNGVESQPIRDQHVVAQVVGENEHLIPGQPYRLGLRLKHDAGWHTYWKSTATGYGPSINWETPENVRISDLSWPTPAIYTQMGLTDYVYEDEVLLVATLSVPLDFTGDSIQLGFTAEWLMCEKVCIPGEATGQIRIPIKQAPSKPSKWQSAFAEHDRNKPADPNAYDLSAWPMGTSVILNVKGDLPEGNFIYFDALARFKPDTVATVLKKSADAIQLKLDLDPTEDALPDRLSGVLFAQNNWPAANAYSSIAIDVPVGPPPTASAESPTIGFGLLALAFIGGLILNLMPCVFPVLGIKIMGFVEHAGADHRKVIRHGLVFALGVLLSFWLLAFVLIILRSGGSQLGWGFQLQSPSFVLCLAILLFAFGLNMFGLFEIGQSAVGVGSNLSARQGYAGSFFSGVLATVVATPCAAPFLAPALGAALALPPLASFAVFTAIALGLASPYLLLSSFPTMVNRLPRPGPWMESFKQSMSFMLFATVGFLLWVLAGQLTESAGFPPQNFLTVLLGLVVIAFALWIFGRWGAYHKPKQTRYIATGLALFLIFGSTWSGIRATQPNNSEGNAIEWVKWEPGKARELAQNGQVVYLDFTARWCVTCQTNKATVFSSQSVRDLFQEGAAIAMKADWTNQDDKISQELANFGRSAVPFNLVYGPGLEQPIILPEILTPQIVLDALQKAR